MIYTYITFLFNELVREKELCQITMSVYFLRMDQYTNNVTHSNMIKCKDQFNYLCSCLKIDFSSSFSLLQTKNWLIIYNAQEDIQICDKYSLLFEAISYFPSARLYFISTRKLIIIANLRYHHFLAKTVWVVN